MPFLPPSQQRQSTEGKIIIAILGITTRERTQSQYCSFLQKKGIRCNKWQEDIAQNDWHCTSMSFEIAISVSSLTTTQHQRPFNGL